MATLKFNDNSSIEAAITSSERELVFPVKHFSDCDAIAEKIRGGGLKSLGDNPLTGKDVGVISAVTTADGVLLTVTLHDTEKQQAISDITKGVVGSEEDVPEDLQSIVDLAKRGRDSLADADATVYADYFPAWSGNEVGYTKDQRIQYGGKLYKVLQAHTSQSDWTPDKAASLFAAILPGQSGTEAGAWVQPGSTNPYMKGNKVTHGGYVWTSLVDNNVWEPSESQPTLWSKDAAV